MTTTPNEPVGDDDIDTVAPDAPSQMGLGDADGTDGTGSDADGTDGVDSTDADATDGGDADGTDA